MSIEQQLSQLTESLRIELIGDARPEMLKPVQAIIGPDLPSLEATDILEGNVDITAIIQPLTALRKDIRFTDPFPEALTDDRRSFKDIDKTTEVIGGMPIATPVTGGFTTVPGVPGIIAQLSGLVASLTGKIPIPSTTTLPVTMQAQWFVTDKDGVTELQPGKEYFAPGGVAGRAASFLFLPKFSEQTPAPDPVSSRWLYAKVKLLAGAFSSPEVKLPGVEIRVPSIALAPLLAERFKVNLADTVVRPATPAVAELIETQVPNVFTKIRDLVPAVNVSFSYTLTRNGQAPSENDVVSRPGEIFPRSSSWSVGALLRFYMRPTCEALRETTSQTEWRLAVQASVSALPGTTASVPVSLPLLKLFQLPVRLPVLVGGFDDRYWSGDEAIVFLNHNTSLMHGHVDRNDISAVEQVKAALLAPLDATDSILTTLEPLFPDLAGVPLRDQLSHLRSFIQRIRERPPRNLVLTAEEKRDDLGKYNPSWYDRLTSLFMIGVPDGTTFKLFEGKEQQSHELHLRMPVGFVAASYWTIHQSAWKLEVPFNTPPTIPDPGREQEGRSANYPKFSDPPTEPPTPSFGNMAKSFRWD